MLMPLAIFRGTFSRGLTIFRVFFYSINVMEQTLHLTSVLAVSNVNTFHKKQLAIHYVNNADVLVLSKLNIKHVSTFHKKKIS